MSVSRPQISSACHLMPCYVGDVCQQASDKQCLSSNAMLSPPKPTPRLTAYVYVIAFRSKGRSSNCSTFGLLSYRPFVEFSVITFRAVLALLRAGGDFLCHTFYVSKLHSANRLNLCALCTITEQTAVPFLCRTDRCLVVEKECLKWRRTFFRTSVLP
jgi:hypothetical protein